jgi:hypothetical protein
MLLQRIWQRLHSLALSQVHRVLSMVRRVLRELMVRELTNSKSFRYNEKVRRSM